GVGGGSRKASSYPIQGATSAKPQVGERQMIRSVRGSFGLPHIPRLASKVVQPAPKSVRVVVGIQHPLTTFRAIIVTPKKSANARLFCFPRWAMRIRLAAD
ncbi:MAG: hypothetical protein WB420_17760, partial [Bradyrhizobium sp.]